MQGDVVTNVDLRDAMEGHKVRRKKDNSAIMTVLLQEVGGWGLEDDEEKKEEDNLNVDADGFTSTLADNPNSPPDCILNNQHSSSSSTTKNNQLPPLRSSTDDLLLAIDTTHSNRILLWDSHPNNSHSSIPTIFFTDNSSNITLTRNYLDVGIDICSPDVLARFSDEFDYRELRSQFVANCVAEEEIGLQSRIFGYMMKRGEYAGRMGDMRRYHRVSMDLLRRWCYPLVPDNYGHHENTTLKVEGCNNASYVCERHLVYRDVGVHNSSKDCNRSHVGRSTQLLGPLLLGPNNSIGEQCWLQRSVLGPNCTVSDDCSVIDSHLWGNVLIEKGAQLTGVIVCEGATIRKGAVVERGCVIGQGCIIGEGVHLKEFTRITRAAEIEEDDDYSGFDDSSSSSSSSGEEDSSSSGDSEENGEEEDEEDGSYEKVKSKEDAVVVDNTATSLSEAAADTITNHEVVGKDGLGRVYTPSPPDEYDSDDDEEEAQAAAMELMQSQSIGYDMALIYKKWKKLQMEDEDDGFSLEGMGSDDDGMDVEDDGWENDAGGAAVGGNMQSTTSSSHLDDDGMQVVGRQKGVDVVKELRDICLEHETSHPVDNLRIEIQSFKFSQNAAYADCCKGVMMAVMEKILEEVGGESAPSPGKLVGSLKSMLGYWGTLLQSFCIGSKEEQAIIHTLESMALGSTSSSVLGKEPTFRFVLQTLHDQEIVNEEAIFEWASERKEEDKDSALGMLFLQKPTQDFLEWLDDDSSSGEDSDGDDSSDGEDSD